MVNTVMVSCDLMNETEKAWCVAVDGDDTNPIWVPKSLSVWIPDKHEDGVSGEIEVPEWFAEKEGMI